MCKQTSKQTQLLSSPDLHSILTQTFTKLIFSNNPESNSKFLQAFFFSVLCIQDLQICFLLKENKRGKSCFADFEKTKTKTKQVIQKGHMVPTEAMIRFCTDALPKRQILCIWFGAMSLKYLLSSELSLLNVYFQQAILFHKGMR